MDLQFLEEKAPTINRAKSRYRNAIPAEGRFAADSAQTQLALFDLVGYRAELAREVIADLDARFPKPSAGKKPHVLLFAGHRIDRPERPTARFPQRAAGPAKDALRKVLGELQEGDGPLIGFASAAPGADILFHEICRELGIENQLCLPMASNFYAAMAFDQLDDWRGRYLDLVAIKELPRLELGGPGGLQHWLASSRIDPWERGNRWVLQMGLAMDARKITLLTLWDRKEEGDDRGGTAHMVSLAGKTGRIHLINVDTAAFLA